MNLHQPMEKKMSDIYMKGVINQYLDLPTWALQLIDLCLEASGSGFRTLPEDVENSVKVSDPEVRSYFRDFIDGNTVLELGCMDYRLQPDGLCVLVFEDGVEDDAVNLLQFILQHWEEGPSCLCLEWSGWSDKVRPDSFGGGATFITRTEIKYFTTHDWLNEQYQHLKVPATRLDKKESADE